LSFWCSTGSVLSFLLFTIYISLLDPQLICLLYLHRTILPVLFVPLISCCFSVSQLKVILVAVPFVLLLLCSELVHLILSWFLPFYLPLKVLSKLTLSSLSFTHPSTSCPHQRLKFYFRHWRVTNLHYYYYYIMWLKFGGK